MASNSFFLLIVLHELYKTENDRNKGILLVVCHVPESGFWTTLGHGSDCIVDSGPHPHSTSSGHSIPKASKKIGIATGNTSFKQKFV